MGTMEPGRAVEAIGSDGSEFETQIGKSEIDPAAVKITLPSEVVDRTQRGKTLQESMAACTH